MQSPTDLATIRARSEALPRALVRQLRGSTIACVVTVVIVSVAWALVAVPAFVTTVAGDPGLTLVLALAGFAVAVVLIPTAVQLLVLSDDDRAMAEGYNAFAVLDQQRAPALPTFAMWRMRTPEAVLRWMDDHPTYEPHRVRALLGAGRVDEAMERLAGLPTASPEDRFQRDILESFADFVRGGTGSLIPAFGTLDEITAGPERDYAQATLAFETARRSLATGGDWRRPLIECRRRFGTELPKGASYWDRFRAGIPIVLAVIFGGALVGLFISVGY